MKDIKLKGYSNDYLLNKLKTKIVLKEKNKDKKYNCIHCNKEFISISTCNRHQKFNCQKNENKISMDTKLNQLKNEIKTQLLNELKNELKNKLKNKIKVKDSNKIVDNNRKTKIENLNLYCNDTLDIDTFINNFENNKKYHITEEEATSILTNIEKLGIESYKETLFEILKSKYYLQFKDLTHNKQETNDDNSVILPFVSSDINLRSYYEKSQKGWVLVKSFDKIINILKISDKQIYELCNKSILYPKKGKTPVVNYLLRKSDYLQISKKFSEKEIKDKEDIVKDLY